MEKINIELQETINDANDRIYKGTQFEVNEIDFNHCKKRNLKLKVIHKGQERGISIDKFNIITTPLEFANQNDYVILECINTNSDIELGSLHKVKKEVWENSKEFLHLNKNVKVIGNFFKERFKIHQPNTNTPIVENISNKPKESFYNKIIIKSITDIQVQPNTTIKKGDTFTVDLKDWDDNKLYLKINVNKEYYNCDKSNFRSVRTIHEEVGIFPSIPANMSSGKSDIGKMMVFGTGGLELQEPRTTKWWGWDKSGDLTFIDSKGNTLSKDEVGKTIENTDSLTIHSALGIKDNSYENFWTNEEARLNGITKITPEEYYKQAVGFPSRNTESIRTKSWQDQVLEASQYYNSSIIQEKDKTIQTLDNNIFPTQGLKDRIEELKQSSIDQVGIPPTKFGIGIQEQIELAKNYSIFPINENDQTYTLYSPSRRIGITWQAQLLDTFKKLYKESKSPFTNITFTKKVKKKKQHIVEPMSNIKL